MFAGHIASNFAQYFTLKTYVSRLHCCLQVFLNSLFLTQIKLHIYGQPNGTVLPPQGKSEVRYKNYGIYLPGC